MKTYCYALMCMLSLVIPITGNAADSAEEAANKQLVLDYYRDLEAALSAGKLDELPRIDARYRAPGYIQHSVTAGPTAGSPPSAGGAPAGGPPPAGGPAPKLLAIMAEGDKVIQVTSRLMPGADGKPTETIIFNMFRVQDDKLIEHWDAFAQPGQVK